jgi:hypothetical protein
MASAVARILLRRSRVTVGLSLSLAIALLSPPAPAASVTAGQVWVPYPRLLAQLRSGPLIRVIVNPARMDVEIKFPNLDEWHAYYPAGAESEIQRLVRARHVHVIYVPRPKAAAATQTTPAGGHPLRWALAGVAAAVALAGAAAIVLRARRRRRDAPG